MTKETEPKGNFFTHTFDANGRITDANDQQRRDMNNLAAKLPMIPYPHHHGHQCRRDIVTYLDQTAPSGVFTSTTTVSGVVKPTIYTRSADELTAKLTLPDLTVQDYQFDSDPQYKFKYLKSQKITTPSGLKTRRLSIIARTPTPILIQK